MRKDPVLLKKFYLANKEIDIYESLKTLFFPTLREFIIKYGDSNPEYIYSPSRKYWESHAILIRKKEYIFLYIKSDYFYIDDINKEPTT